MPGLAGATVDNQPAIVYTQYDPAGKSDADRGLRIAGFEQESAWAERPRADDVQGGFPMGISEAEVRKVALLARITLNDEEVRRFKAQLDSILDYVGKLNELDTTDVEPMAHAVEMSNVFRADEVRPSMGVEEALANAPKRTRTFFVVPPVFE